MPETQAASESPLIASTEAAPVQPLVGASPFQAQKKSREPADEFAWQAWIMAGAAVVIALAAVLQIRDERRVALPVVGVNLPELCTWRRLSGIDCPGCGLTRSFISQAHGDFRAAWRYNPAGIPLFALVVAQLPLRAYQMRRIARGKAIWKPPGAIYVTVAVAALMLGQWLWRMVA